VSRTSDIERWLFCRTARPQSRLRLFCVPYAGGGASAFNAWPGVFPETVELRAVQLPGRESRYREPALSDVHEAAHLLANALEPYLDRRYAFFGYSMGVLIAFEALRELRRRGVPPPELFFVGALRCPSLPAYSPPLAQLPPDAFVREMRQHYDPPATAWDNPDLLELILPVLRADMALCESYIYREEPPFDFPIQAFCGLRDRSAPLPSMRAWRAQTTGEFALEAFDGAHFFLNAFLAPVQQAVILRLERVLRGSI